ncbi:MAG TPA: YggT family protein [Candidatus Lustribacter sp.]|nr:YggT family protein [Candidatus Lustribacter sp.]
MAAVWSLVSLVLFLFFLALISRLVFDWVQVFAREWSPRGPLLVVAEGIYSVTDPPLKALRKVIPSLTIGGMRIDLSFLVLIIIVSILMNLPVP